MTVHKWIIWLGILSAVVALGVFIFHQSEPERNSFTPNIQPADFCRKLRAMLTEQAFPMSRHGGLMLSCNPYGPIPNSPNAPTVFVGLFHDLLGDETTKKIAIESIRKLTAEHGSSVFLSDTTLLDNGDFIGYVIKSGEVKKHRGFRFR